jgi:hypothetical protein
MLRQADRGDLQAQPPRHRQAHGVEQAPDVRHANPLRRAGVRDQAGRPIWPRRFFACWYGDVAASRPSYRALWEAVADERLPRSDHDPVPIVLSPDSGDRAIAAIAEIGLERVAAIAAALLEGPVAMTGTGSAAERRGRDR